jgi:hypothetical protein
MQDIDEIDNSISEKLDRLRLAGFSDRASYIFFGSLNISELKRLRELLDTEMFYFLEEKQKDFIHMYVTKLILKLEEQSR